MLSALCFFSDNELTEHTGKESRFIVDGLVLNQALDCQQQKHKSQQPIQIDLHLNLPTDDLDFKEELKLLHLG